MKKTLKKMGSLFIALAMLLAMSVPAFAAFNPGDDVTSVTVNKTVDIGDNLSVPAATFNFTIDPQGTPQAPTGGLTQNTAASIAAGQTSATNGALSINASEFTAPGTYTYKVTENSTSAVDGFTYDTAEKYVHLYIANNDTTGTSWDPYCYAAVVTDGATAPDAADLDNVDDTTGDAEYNKQGSLQFTNKYKEKTDGELIHVTVNKTVTGNQGDQTKEFTFTVSLSDLKTTRDIIIEKPDGTQETLTDGAGSATVTLKHGQSFTIHGLNEGEKYSIVETQQEGYKGKVDTGEFGAADTAVTLSNQTVGTTHAEHTFTNDKTGTIPTGIFLNYKPYWIMGAIALVLAVFFFARRKNRFADEF